MGGEIQSSWHWFPHKNSSFHSFSLTLFEHRQHFPMSSRSIQHKYSQNKHPTVATKQRLGSNQHKNLYLTVATKQKLRPNLSNAKMQKLALNSYYRSKSWGVNPLTVCRRMSLWAWEAAYIPKFSENMAKKHQIWPKNIYFCQKIFFFEKVQIWRKNIKFGKKIFFWKS